MNAAELNAAADKLATVAEQRRGWSRQASTETDARLFREVAQQFQDRADQTRSWARSAAHREGRGETYPAEVAAQIETAVRTFLHMAGSTVDNA